MTLDDLQRTIEAARLAYQVQVDEELPYLVAPQNITIAILAPGTFDTVADKRLDGWVVAIGEDGDERIARGEGATLDAAAQALCEVVRERTVATSKMLVAAVRGVS